MCWERIIACLETKIQKLFAACYMAQIGSAAQIVSFAGDTRNVLAVCYTSDLLRGLLPTLLEQLEMCQKSLTAYLETKRAEFPRFYFVSDPTLLEILSLGSDPPSVVPHFQSGLFDSLSGVTFDKVKLAALCFPIRHMAAWGACCSYPGKGTLELCPLARRMTRARSLRCSARKARRWKWSIRLRPKVGSCRSLQFTLPTTCYNQQTADRRTVLY